MRVKVVFDRNKTSLDDIYNQAIRLKCADQVFGHMNENKGKVIIKPTATYRMDKEDKYYLLHSKYKIVPMTSLQKTKVNSALGFHQNPEIFLSPRQLSILNNVKFKESQVQNNIQDVWYK